MKKGEDPPPTTSDKKDEAKKKSLPSRGDDPAPGLYRPLDYTSQKAVPLQFKAGKPVIQKQHKDDTKPITKSIAPSPKPIVVSPKAIAPSPKATGVSPKPIGMSPKPIGVSPKPIVASPKPTDPSPKPIVFSPKPIIPEIPKAPPQNQTPKPPTPTPEAPPDQIPPDQEEEAQKKSDITPVLPKHRRKVKKHEPKTEPEPKAEAEEQKEKVEEEPEVVAEPTMEEVPPAKEEEVPPTEQDRKPRKKNPEFGGAEYRPHLLEDVLHILKLFERTEDVEESLKVLKRYGIPKQGKLFSLHFDSDPMPYHFDENMKLVFSPTLRRWIPTNFGNRYLPLSKFIPAVQSIRYKGVKLRPDEFVETETMKAAKKYQEIEMKDEAENDSHREILKALAIQQMSSLPLTVMYEILHQQMQVVGKLCAVYNKSLGSSNVNSKVAIAHHLLMKKHLQVLEFLGLHTLPPLSIVRKYEAPPKEENQNITSSSSSEYEEELEKFLAEEGEMTAEQRALLLKEQEEARLFLHPEQAPPHKSVHPTTHHPRSVKKATTKATSKAKIKKNKKP